MGTFGSLQLGSNIFVQHEVEVRLPTFRDMIPELRLKCFERGCYPHQTQEKATYAACFDYVPDGVVSVCTA